MTMELKGKPDIPFRVPPGIKADLGRRAHRPAGRPGQGTILEAFKPGTAPPESYAGGDASPRQLEPEAEPRPGPWARGRAGLY